VPSHVDSLCPSFDEQFQSARLFNANDIARKHDRSITRATRAGARGSDDRQPRERANDADQGFTL
jgi:hypothetical protein